MCTVIPQLIRNVFRTARMLSRLRLSGKDCKSLIGIRNCLCGDVPGVVIHVVEQEYVVVLENRR